MLLAEDTVVLLHYLCIKCTKWGWKDGLVVIWFSVPTGHLKALQLVSDMQVVHRGNIQTNTPTLPIKMHLRLTVPRVTLITLFYLSAEWQPFRHSTDHFVTLLCILFYLGDCVIKRKGVQSHTHDCGWPGGIHWKPWVSRCWFSFFCLRSWWVSFWDGSRAWMFVFIPCTMEQLWRAERKCGAADEDRGKEPQ